VEANSTGGQGSRRAVALSDDDYDKLQSTSPEFFKILLAELHMFKILL
jgi:hypothetical protein